MKNKSKQIWIVYGETGEYSDHARWEVAAYTKEEDAALHAKKATEWYWDNGGIQLRDLIYRHNSNLKNPFDSLMIIDYTGTQWHYYPITLYSSFESYENRK